MRVLHVASGDFFSTYGGGQVYVKNVVDAMLDRGIDVCILSFHDSSENQPKKYRNADIIELSSRYTEQQIFDAIEKLHPDIIHAHSNKPIICTLGRRLNIPVVVTSHHGGILCPGGALMNTKHQICNKIVNHKDCLPCVLSNIPGNKWLWYPLMRFLPKRTYLSLGKFLHKKPFILFVTPVGCAAKSIQDKKEDWQTIIDNCSLLITPCYRFAEAIKINGFPEEKLTVIPHGIPVPAKRHPYPDIKDGKIKFYYVGRISIVKGIHILINAFIGIGDPDIELHLIGASANKNEDRYMSKLKSQSENDPRIIWHGKVAPEKIYEVTKDLHISISPSICLEAFGLNIAESLALGKPVIATRSGGGEMQIRDGENGWLVEPNDVNAMRKAICHIIDNPDLPARLSPNCNAISIDDHIDELLKSYNRVIHAHDKCASDNKRLYD